jgi:thymidine phosphorylase
LVARPREAGETDAGVDGILRPGAPAAERAAASLRAAYQIGATPPEPREAVMERLG